MSITAYHFWSPTCGPCKVIKPAIEDLKDEFPSVSLVVVNTHEDHQGLSRTLGVQVVPTIVVVVRSKEGASIYTDKHSGTAMMGYYRIIRAAMRLVPQ